MRLRILRRARGVCTEHPEAGSSTHSAASSLIRRPSYDGQLNLDPRENATRSSSPHRRQFKARSPCSKSRHRSTPSKSSANFGNEAPFSSARSNERSSLHRIYSGRNNRVVQRRTRTCTPYQRMLGLGVASPVTRALSRRSGLGTSVRPRTRRRSGRVREDIEGHNFAPRHR